MMQQPQEFSAQSIKQKVASLPDTYYGEECNVSLKSNRITMKSSVDGEPLRFANFGLALCCNGSISAEVNLSEQTVESGHFEIFFPGAIYSLKTISDNCEIIGITISPFLLNEILHEKDKPFLTNVGKHIKVRLDESETSLFRQMANVYLQILKTYGETSQISREMTSCITQFAIQIFSSHISEEKIANTRAEQLCDRFIGLLGQSGGTKREIGWFAENLCVSNHYLSIAIKQYTGQSVKSLIDRAVINEIKILLRHSNLSVTQIADRLEFPNCSFICKYFKAKTGFTPLHYRRGK